MDHQKRARPAEVFHPGVYIRDEMEARAWSQADLSEILGRPPRLINELIGGTRSISPETAKGLAEAFGTSAELWMNLQSAYELWRSDSTGDVVSRRARLYSIAPIREMVKRGWIEDSESIDVLESQVARFFELKSLDDDPRLNVAARTPLENPRPAQIAWFFRARNLGKALQAARFSAGSLNKCIEALRPLMIAPEEARHVPRVLADAGIRFVIVEPLQKAKIDGATIWLDKKTPVIALSMRYDRIDWFWHTLLHELEHVRRRHNYLDVDLQSHKDDAQEIEADRAAQENLVPSERLDDFVNRVRPLYSHRRIQGFASTVGVHPGIVVGQLQFRGEISYAHSRGLLVKIREHVIQSALTDGWGAMLSSSI